MTDDDYKVKLKERRALEERLSAILRGLLDRPDNILLLQQLGKHGIHVSDVRLCIHGPETLNERYEREMWVMQTHHDLARKTRRYTWNAFVDICAAKMDIDKPWLATAARALGFSYQSMLSYKAIDFVPGAWVERILELPDRPLPPVEAALRPRGRFAHKDAPT